MALAIQTFHSQWVLYFGDPNDVVRSALNKLMIDISPEVKKAVNGYSLNGIRLRWGRLRGLTLSPGWIWVYDEIGTNLCESSLVHELVHVAIWTIKGTDADPDHEGFLYKGWTPRHSEFIDSVNSLLCRLEID